MDLHRRWSRSIYLSVVDVSGDDEVADVSGGGMVNVSGEVVVVSGGEHGRKNGDGRYAFSCSIDYGGA